MAVKLASIFIPQFFDASGNPLSGGKLFTYVGGSVSTKQTTYKDSGGLNAHANPIILDSSGYPSAAGSVQEIWLTSGMTYKFVLAPSTDSDPPTSPIWTADNLSGINDTTVTIDEWVSGPAPTYVGATQFTLAGDQTGTFTVGRRIKATVTAGTVYGRITASVFAASTTVTVQCDGTQAIDSGLSAVSYALLASSVKSEPERIATTSGTDTYTATVGISRLVIGDEYKVKIGTTNTLTNPTLNLDSTGAKTIVRADGSAMQAGDLSGEHTFRWNGTNMVVLDINKVIKTYAAGTFLAGPTSGAAAAPTDRAIVGADASEMLIGAVQTANASATIDFTAASYAAAFDGSLGEVTFHWEGVRPATDAVVFQALAGTGAGPTWHSTISDYEDAGNRSDDTGTNTGFGQTTSASIRLSGPAQLGNATTKAANGSALLSPSAANTAFHKSLRFSGNYVTAAGGLETIVGSSRYVATTAWTGVRFQLGSGNIAEGIFWVTGKRKS